MPLKQRTPNPRLRKGRGPAPGGATKGQRTVGGTRRGGGSLQGGGSLSTGSLLALQQQRPHTAGSVLGALPVGKGAHVKGQAAALASRIGSSPSLQHVPLTRPVSTLASPVSSAFVDAFSHSIHGSLSRSIAGDVQERSKPSHGRRGRNAPVLATREPAVLQAAAVTLSTHEIVHPQSAANTRTPLKKLPADEEFWRTAPDGGGVGSLVQGGPMGVLFGTEPQHGGGATAELGGVPSPQVSRSPSPSVSPDADELHPSRPSTAPGLSAAAADGALVDVSRPMSSAAPTAMNGRAAHGVQGGVYGVDNGGSHMPSPVATAPGSAQSWRARKPASGGGGATGTRAGAGVRGASATVMSRASAASLATSMAPTDDVAQNAARAGLVRDLLFEMLSGMGDTFGLSDQGKARLAQVPEEIGRAMFWKGPRPGAVRSGSRPSTRAGLFGTGATPSRGGSPSRGGDRGELGGAAGRADVLVLDHDDDNDRDSDSELDSSNGGSRPASASSARPGTGGTERLAVGANETLTPYFELVREHQKRKIERDKLREHLLSRIAAAQASHEALNEECSALQQRRATAVSQMKREQVKLSKLDFQVASVAKESRMQNEMMDEAYRDMDEAKAQVRLSKEQLGASKAALQVVMARIGTMDIKLKELIREKKEVQKTFDKVSAIGGGMSPTRSVSGGSPTHSSGKSPTARGSLNRAQSQASMLKFGGSSRSLASGGSPRHASPRHAPPLKRAQSSVHMLRT